MNIRRKNRLWIACAVLAGLALTIGLVLYALRSNIDLFYTPGRFSTASVKLSRCRKSVSVCALADGDAGECAARSQFAKSNFHHLRR